ncbi:DUF1576 domain-containing protein [Aerococcaceae bacterium zg-B36]|uniref:DUF1576 domain-containing protein n=1 Tax=Aerococcaceae bacterium zg-252 TaxID=2796928 RepID=UPI001BD85112|nr:DUF1576 domain-containing protein [Aerococcaceae bacterium zg-B36]
MSLLLRFFKTSIIRKHFILFLAIFTLIFALFMPDRHALWHNYLTIITQPTHLLQDFFALGGLSATFFNAATHLFLMYALFMWNDQTKLSGFQIGAMGIYLGHSFFGTHLINILPIIGGVILYAIWTKQSFKRFTTISLFATSLAPMVSTLIAHNHSQFTLLWLIVVIGLILGFITPVLSEHFLKFHQGFALYNSGFTTGIIAMFALLILQLFEVDISSRTIINNEVHIYTTVYFLCLLLFAFCIYLHNPQKAHQNFPKLLKRSGRLPDDFMLNFQAETTALNIFLNGGIYLALILLLGIRISGPVLGGLCSVLGFSAFGKHPRNCLPISAGVLAIALLTKQDITQIQVALPLLFGTSLAPVAGYYGVLAGIIAGALQFLLASTVFPLHQGLTLYNNGFSSGFIAAFMVPIIDIILEHRPNNV